MLFFLWRWRLLVTHLINQWHTFRPSISPSFVYEKCLFKNCYSSNSFLSPRILLLCRIFHHWPRPPAVRSPCGGGQGRLPATTLCIRRRLKCMRLHLSKICMSILTLFKQKYISKTLHGKPTENPNHFYIHLSLNCIVYQHYNWCRIS